MELEGKAHLDSLSNLKQNCSTGDLREALTFMAKTAERAERYNDMCAYMRELAITYKGDLSKDERDLLIISYKRVLGDVRQSWKNLRIEDDTKFDDLRIDYCKQVQDEFIAVCNDGLDLFEKVLCQAKTKNSESKVFYLKTTADYYRFLSEIKKSNLGRNNVEKNVEKKASEYYKEAMARAESKLPPTSPILLDVALNYSVCVYEILKETKQACFLAKTAFDAAISKLDDLDDATYKDSTLIMQLLRDNLTLWTSDRDRSRRSYHR